MSSRTKTIILVLILAVVAGGAGVAFKLYSALHTKPEEITTEIQKDLDKSSPEYEALKQKGKFNMLILGEDNVEGSRRSDTILFTTVDLRNNSARVLSLPRDTRVEIPGHGTQKLNHAFAFGGPELLCKTVENYLNQPVLYYLIVDYDSFPKLIDTLGGVDINVKKRMHYVDRAGHLNININPGLQHMGGEQALHYVRFRKDALGDIGRVQRQQAFLKALLKKAYSPAVIVKIPEVTAQMVKIFKTDMSATIAIQLAGFTKNDLKRENIFFSTLHGTAQMVDRLSYWIGDTEAANAFIEAPLEALTSGDVSIDRTSDSKYAGVSLAYTSAVEDPSGAAGVSSDKKSGDKTSGSVTGSTEKKAAELTQADLLKIVRSMPESVAVLNGTGQNGICDKAARKLQIIGIDVVFKGNAKHFDYNFSNVVYPINASVKTVSTAKSLGSLLQVPKNLVRPNKQAFYASIIIGHDYKALNDILDKLVSISKQ